MVHSFLVHFLEISAISTSVLSSFLFFYVFACIISHPVANLSCIMSFLLQFAISGAKAAAHVSFVSCCITFSSSLCFIHFHLLFIFVSRFSPLFIPVFSHACLSSYSYHVFSFLLVSSFFSFGLTLFISPVICHVCFIERRENT